ncbi:hypothetical protein L249_2530, partial [Ophiocordyceps polyrhachis-furcata BCC 54312]
PKARHNALSHSGAIARLLQRSARCTYSSYSTRLISAQGSRHIDRRAVLIAVIALDQSDRRAVLIAVIAPDLDSQIMPNTKKITFAKLSGGDNYTY